MAKKEVIYQGLSDLNVLIDDTTANSPDYFRVTNLPREFTAGINIFKFKGNPTLFPEGSSVYIEVLDANGLPVYYEIGLDLESEEQSAIISVYINEDTVSGNGSITICGQANQSSSGQILDPSEINVRWTAPVYIDISKRNVDDIIFDELPEVSITATTGSYTNLGYPSNIRTESATWSNVPYVYRNEEAILYTSSFSSPGFPATATNTQIFLYYGDIEDANQRTNEEISTLAEFTSSISAYSGSGIAYLTDPIIFSVNNSSEQHIVQSGRISAIDVVYEQSASLASQTTQNTHNIAVVQFSGLQPQIGEIAKIRSYYKSAGVQEYIFSNETDISDLADEFGFTANVVTASFALPTIHRNDRFDFKFEFINPSGYVSKQVLEYRDVLFQGGNTYIGGDDNLITGSLYVAGATGTGVHISGKGNAAMIRSIGYEGFTKASLPGGKGGFVIYSGSVQPLLNATENYSGVGIELFANTASYFKYTTSGSGLLDIRTDSFFLGSQNQFVSGANGKIEISSSNFHLKPDGSVNMSGDINANTGIFKDVNIIGNIPSASISLGNKYIIENWVRTPADINTGFYKFTTGSDASNTINQGLLNWTSSHVPNGAVTASALSGSLELPPGFLNWGSIINNFKGAEYNGYVGTTLNILDFLDFQVPANNATASITSELIDFSSLFNKATTNNTPVPTLMLQFSTQFNALAVSSYSSYTTGSFTGQDPTTIVEILDSANTILYSDSRIQLSSNYLRDWNNFSIPLLSILSDNNYVLRKKFRIRISWNKFFDPIGTGTVKNFRITELRIVDLPTSLGFATNAIQLQDSAITSNLGGSDHSGNWAPAEDIKFDLGTFNVRGDDVGIQLITPKRWRTVYSKNINTDQFTIADSTTTATTGRFSMATGNKSTSVSKYSHTEGKYATTLGPNSHAEGFATIAHGDGSHAEGYLTATTKVLKPNGNAYGYVNAIYTLITIPTSVSASSGQYLFPGDITPYLDSGLPVYMTSGSYVGKNIISTVQTIQSVSSNGISSSLFITNYTGSFNSLLGNSLLYNGTYSHAEGRETQAAGRWSHAEGKLTQATGKYSHAEGGYSYAQGDYSHAEGYLTIASGSNSHAEGFASIAQGAYSHAEGYYTSASGDYQHVQGQFNIKSLVQSAFIIGNGTSNANRSNLVFASGSQFQVTGSVAATAGFIKPGAGSQYLLADGTTTAGTGSSAFPYIGSAIITGSLLIGTGSSFSAGFGFTPNVSIGMNTGSTGAVLDLKNTSTTGTISGSTLGAIQFGNREYTTSQIIATQAGGITGGDSGGGHIAIWTNPAGTAVYPVERFRITSTGNVGIGTKTPGYALDVAGTGNATSDFRAPIFYDSNDTGYYVNPASTSRLNSLLVDGTISSNGSITGTLVGTASYALTSSLLNSTTNAFIQSGNSFGTTALLGTTDNNSLALETNGSTRMFISSSGNVGIGIAAPSQKLDISGSVIIFGSLIQGSGSIASGTFSHAEGRTTIAQSQYSHAEGQSTTASGDYSHAEGQNTQASGNYSHAEGYQTKAYGNRSHAEGRDTISSGSYSHAEGYLTVALGEYSHAEGEGTLAQGQGSHAEGTGSITQGEYSHAKGYFTTAFGNFSHAEGRDTVAVGTYSHAEGRNTSASANYSHAEGRNTIASGQYAHVQGQYNLTSSAESTFIVGNGTSNANRSNLMFASGSEVQITGSLMVKDILQLSVRTTTPTAIEGMVIASGSAGASKIYYYNGTIWNALF